MIALLIGLGLLALFVFTAWTLRQHRDALAPSVTHTAEERRFVLRIDPPDVPGGVRGAVWALATMGVLGAASPFLLWSKETMTPSAAVLWLLAVGAVAAAVAWFDRGFGWPTPTRRLGLDETDVWWDQIDRHARPGPLPTSVAHRMPRGWATLTRDGRHVVVSGANGDGVIFGPVSEADYRLLEARWGRRP